MTPGYVIKGPDGTLWTDRSGVAVWFTRMSHAELYWSNAKHRDDDHELWDIVPYNLEMIADRREFLDKIAEKRMRRMEGGR